MLLTKFMVGIVVLWSILDYIDTHPRQIYPKPPLYPGATSIQKFTHGSTMPFRTITFEVSASPETLLNYYNEVLVKSGWGPENGPTTRDTLSFRTFASRLPSRREAKKK